MAAFFGEKLMKKQLLLLMGL